jgi:NADPH:quinone reductase-like Zn-dependent oxidoreductase
MARVVRFHQTGGPEVLKIEEVEVGEPGPQEIRVRVEAIGLNRAEAMFRSGQYLEQPNLPARLGYEASAIVEGAGQRCERFPCRRNRVRDPGFFDE